VLGVALETAKYQAPAAAGFWRGLAMDDGLAARDPRKTLLRYLLENRAHGGIENFYQSKACSLAWNAFVRGEDLARLRTKVAGPLVLLGTPWSATRDGQQKFPDWLQPKPDMAAPNAGSDVQPKPIMAAPPGPTSRWPDGQAELGPSARLDVQRTSKSAAPETLFQTGVQVGPNGAAPVILYRRRGARA
jgi:hypothetical protein